MSFVSPSTSILPLFPSTLPTIQHPPHALPPDFDAILARLHADRDSVAPQSPDHRLQWASQALDYVEVVTAHATRAYPSYSPASSHASLQAEATAIVEHFVKQGTPRALYCKATWFEFGKFGHTQDRKAAFQLYKSAAQNGFPRAEYRLGVQYEKADDMRRAIQIYKRAAAKNDCAANYRLGMITILGQHGHKQDFAKGVSRLHLAAATADQDAPQGCYIFGLLLAKDLPEIYIPEEFLPKDTHAAVSMLEKAANLGFGPALLKLGNIYEFGNYDQPFDPAVSLYYYTLASIRGEVEADMALSKWYLCGSEGIFEKNEELAFVLALRAASRGNATAEFALGYFYEVGIHVSPDFGKAQVYYEKALEHGSKDAQARLEGISRSNTLTRKDHEHNVKTQLVHPQIPPIFEKAECSMPDSRQTIVSQSVGEEDTSFLRPQVAQSARQSMYSQHRRGSSSTFSSPPASPVPILPSSSASTTVKKGPQTFAEMGIPPPQKKEDCLLM